MKKYTLLTLSGISKGIHFPDNCSAILIIIIFFIFFFFFIVLCWDITRHWLEFASLTSRLESESRGETHDSANVLYHFSTIPDWLSWLQYLSWFKYGFETLVVNQWDGYENIGMQFIALDLLIVFNVIILRHYASLGHVITWWRSSTLKGNTQCHNDERDTLFWSWRLSAI